MDVSEEELQPLYSWVDSLNLSRPKRNIARDFSNGGSTKSRTVRLCHIGPSLYTLTYTTGSLQTTRSCPS